MRNDKPEPEVEGIKVFYNQGQPSRIEMDVRHFVGNWYNVGFRFDVEDSVASIERIQLAAKHIWIDENRPAREKAYEAVLELPFIDEVDKIDD